MNSADYYYREKFYEEIIKSLKENNVDKLSRKNLSGFDEFHTGGARATELLLKNANIHSHFHVLDIGCGIGGPARMIADERNCKVTGIDITPENIRTARLLTDLLDIKNVDFIIADATSLPFDHDTFDVIWTQHVQMNIKNKKAFYNEISRVLKTNGEFYYYDIFLRSTGEVKYPMPWASRKEESFLIFPEEADGFLSRAGLNKRSSFNHTKDVIQIMETMILTPLPYGQQVLLGDDADKKVKNLLLALKNGVLQIESAVFSKA